MFNKNIIELGNNVEYIKKAVDTVAILYAKQRCDCKDDMPAYFKMSLNQITKIKSTKVMKLLHNWYRAAGFNPKICKVY